MSNVRVNSARLMVASQIVQFSNSRGKFKHPLQGHVHSILTSVKLKQAANFLKLRITHFLCLAKKIRATLA